MLTSILKIRNSIKNNFLIFGCFTVQYEFSNLVFYDSEDTIQTASQTSLQKEDVSSGYSCEYV